ncbi:MAG: hypothetical protein CME19_06410 [Gemmatimonadetes bacterium]|nr:hypothetical protein [Gemmatimonadota bacterium]|tara:strand:+ start:1693 stop:2889 length:1197 start_codon:yes stop_codon:yes gene_type:complete
MPIQKFTISRDDAVYECFPYICLTTSGRILLVYRESNGHVASEYCRVVLRHSDDAGHSWSERRVLVDEDRSTGVLRAWNCPKIQQLEDGRILLLCDVYDFPPGEWGVEANAEIVLLFSDDDGVTWSEPQSTSARGICPDQVTEMPDGRWLLPINIRVGNANQLTQMLYVSQDQGATWDAGNPMNTDPDRELDEASIVRMPGGELVSYEREDRGRPLQKLISKDGGLTWEGPYDTLNPAAIGMPVAGLTQDGQVLVTARFGLRSRWRVDESDETLSARLAKRTIVIPKVDVGEANRRFVQNVGSGPHILETDDEIVIAAGGTSVHTYAFLEPIESALSPDLGSQKGLLLPLDVDASPFADSGYSSWVEVERGKFLCVNYINDDAPMAQIRGYRFGLEDF